MHLSLETRKKISEALKGKNNPMYGKIGKLNPKYGKHLTEEHKKNISRSAKNNLNYGMKGKHHSKEAKRKVSEANKGKHRSLMMLKNYSKAKSGKNHPLYGIHCSLETKKNQP